MANSCTGELLGTEQNALTLALNFILRQFPNITITHLCKVYGLGKHTLYKIKAGEPTPRSKDFCMKIFVGILATKRLVAKNTNNQDLLMSIDALLRDLTLVSYGIATDRERRNHDLKKKYGVP